MPQPIAAVPSTENVTENTAVVSSQDPFLQFKHLEETSFSGRVDVRLHQVPIHSFYFCLGRLVWFRGGRNPHSRWRRFLTPFHPSVDPEFPFHRMATAARGDEGYEIFSTLLRHHHISRKQMVILIETGISELLFDLTQEQFFLVQSGHKTPEFSTDEGDTIDSPMTLLRLQGVLDQVKTQWEQWKALGLAAYSPSKIVQIRSAEMLRQQANPRTCELLTSLIDGQSTLRHLALRMNQDLAQLTQALLPYVTYGIISLVEPPEETPPLFTPARPTISNLSQDPTVASLGAKRSPLIVCIDDSPHVCNSLELILSRANYRFASITDPLQAIPPLPKLKPDLIILDLVMPVANGYEICTQIRRTSALKDTPVVILTGNDGLVDRVRTKWAGSTGFISKNVSEDLLLKSISQFLVS